jgi:hypothetical protein
VWSISNYSYWRSIHLAHKPCPWTRIMLHAGNTLDGRCDSQKPEELLVTCQARAKLFMFIPTCIWNSHILLRNIILRWCSNLVVDYSLTHDSLFDNEILLYLFLFAQLRKLVVVHVFNVFNVQYVICFASLWGI